MKNTWVISPNVLNDGTTEDFLKRMRERKLAMMGWDNQNKFGRLFAGMQEGDLVIVAQGANRQKRVYFAGYATGSTFSEEIGGSQVQCRRLRNIAELSGSPIPFNEDCAYGTGDRIPAIYSLKQHNPSDVAVIEAVTTLMENQHTQQKMQIYSRLLLTHQQLILTGAPGTGKTFVAKALVEQHVNGQLLRTEFIQFHPNFDYTDFIEGLKPAAGSEAGQVGFELRNGVFKEFCRRAGLAERLEVAGLEWSEENVRQFLAGDEAGQKFWLEWAQNWKKPGDWTARPDLPHFFFVIDEINRAELSRVFGELFFALEPEYRGRRGLVKTQYANLNDAKTFFLKQGDDRFFVPSNVYVIGTMNDLDRSVESFDFALRRRFAWRELKTDEDLFRTMMTDLKPALGSDYDEALRRYLALNRAIVEKDSGGLTTAYQIGPAYFRKLTKYTGLDDRWEMLWENHLEILLHEYLRGVPTAGSRIAALKKAYDAIQAS